MRNERNASAWSTIAALAMLAVFAVSILWALLSGAGVYSRLTQSSRISYDSRTCLQYIATKVRQAPTPEAVRVSSFGGTDALCITQSIDGAAYITRIYCHDGYLRELFTIDEEGFSPEDGEKLLPAQKLQIDWQGALMVITLEDAEQTQHQLKLALRTGEGAAP